jgi:hypothetical protein
VRIGRPRIVVFMVRRIIAGKRLERKKENVPEAVKHSASDFLLYKI